MCCCFFYSQQTVGVIIRMEKETFKVLTQHGKEISVKQHAVQPRKTRAVALDSHQVRPVTKTKECNHQFEITYMQ